MRLGLTVALAVVLLVLLLPAQGGPADAANRSVNQRLASLEKRATLMERRTNALAALSVLIRGSQHLDTTRVVFASADTDSSGSASGTASCPAGLVATGGGAQFLTPQVGDSIIYSRPGSLAGTPRDWQVAARKASGAAGILEVYVVCASSSGN